MAATGSSLEEADAEGGRRLMQPADCDTVARQGRMADRADRGLGLRPAQLLPDQALLPLGGRLARLHHGQRDEHRLHRRRRRAGAARPRPPALTTYLLIGALIWSYLSMLFDILSETVSWERWEGTIEYTFMSPASRATHLLGTSIYAVIYGIVRTVDHVRRDLALLRPRAERTPTTPARCWCSRSAASRWSASGWWRR